MTRDPLPGGLRDPVTRYAYEAAQRGTLAQDLANAQRGIPNSDAQEARWKRLGIMGDET